MATTTLATAVPPTDAPPARRRWSVVLGAILLVLVGAEGAVRLVEDRLPPPPDWYTPEYGVKEDQIDALGDRGGASVVFVGSSVIDVAVDPARLTDRGGRPGYNAGLIGANLEMVDVWSEHVVEPALQPDVVVIGVSSRDVNANGAALESQTPGFYRLPAVRRLLGRESVPEQVERRAGELSKLVRYRSVLRRPLEAVAGYDAPDRNLAKNTDLGLELHLAETAYRGDASVEAFFRREPLHDFELSDRQVAALRRTIDRLRSAGRRVVLVDVPITDQYVALHPNGSDDYRAYERALGVLASETGAELIDAGTWEEPLFSDPLHLNGAGIDALTRLLDGYLDDGRLTLPTGARPAGSP